MKYYIGHQLIEDQQSTLNKAEVKKRLLSFYYLHILGHLRRNNNEILSCKFCDKRISKNNGYR